MPPIHLNKNLIKPFFYDSFFSLKCLSKLLKNKSQKIKFTELNYKNQNTIPRKKI